MRIAIDAHALGGQGGGGATYIRGLVQALAQVDDENEYTLLLTPRQSDVSLPGTERMHRMIVPPDNLPVRISLAIPLVALWSRFDLIHFEHMVPPYCPIPFVVSVHDISFERYPSFFQRQNVIKDRITMPLTMRNAVAVLTLTQFSKDDMIRRYRVPSSRVIVTGCGVDPAFMPIRDQSLLSQVRERYGTSDHFILSVGELQPRKNLQRSIQAYIRLRRSGAIHHKFVLVGRKAWLFDDTFAEARASGFENDIVFTGYVPDTDLVALYSAADVFVYPSLFEGFGLPPLEAMACGTPVITSNTSSLPEVVGDAAVMVDPLNVDALARAIRQLLCDDDERGRLSRQGIERARQFTWLDVGRTVMSTYRSLAR